MAGIGKRKKTKKKKGKTAAEAPPRRSTLTPDERRRVEDMHEILGEVWEPFKTAASAIRGLEAEASPWLELEFWDSLAEAFLRYFGKAITLQVDTAGLLRAQRAAAKSEAANQLLQSTSASNGDDVGSVTGATPVSPSQRRRGGGSGNGVGDAAVSAGGEEGGDSDDHAVVPPVVAPEDVSVGTAVAAAAGVCEEGLLGGDGWPKTGGEGRTVDADEADALEPSGARLEMLPMGAVDHLSRRDRLGIIRKTVPKERRMVVLQRLFHLAQAPAVEVELLVASVKELKDNSSSAEIRDVNLLQTWQGVREERDAAWEHATEQVRLAAESAESAAAVGLEESAEDDSAVAGDDVVVDVNGGDSDSSAAVPKDSDEPLSSGGGSGPSL